jgi:hypothetical protein
MRDLTFRRRFYLDPDAWGDEIFREDAAEKLADENNIIGVCWQDGLPEIEVEPEMTFADDEEQEPKGLVWNITAMDGSFLGNEGSPEMALAVAENLVWDRHDIPPNLRG